MSLQGKFSLKRQSFELDVDLNFPSHGVNAIFGPSGCGKTTLLRLIAGLEKDPQGQLTIGDHIWQDHKTFLPPHERGIGYVFQEASLFDHLSVKGNLDFAFKRVPHHQQKLNYDQIIELIGIGNMLSKSSRILSGGERQRVAIARALLSGPNLLLMDEPLAALDKKSKSSILPLLTKLQSELNIPILYVSHSSDEVAVLADHLTLMEHGRFTAAGPLESLLTDLNFPLAHGPQAESLIKAHVSGYDKDNHLTHLSFAGGGVYITGTELPLNSEVRLRVLAKDVSITLKEAQQTTILNILPGVIREIKTEEKGQIIIALDCGGTSILSRVTKKSAANLGLCPGMNIFIQIKSIAILD